MAEPTLSAWETKGDRTMTLHNAMRGTIALLATFLLACAKGEQSNAAADSTARNLTLAPSETSVARHDVPAPEPAPVETKKAPAPVTRPPAARPKPATPPAPTIYTAAAGPHLDTHTGSLEAVRHGRGATTGDAAKVGAGAAAGAILGRVVGGNKRGTIIGGIVGAAAGAGIAATSKDADIVLPAGAHVIVTLNKALEVKAS